MDNSPHGSGRAGYGYGQDPRVGANNAYYYESMDDVYPPTILALITCFCCFFPGGVCACLSLLKCQECSQAIAKRDFDAARQKREEAMRWLYVAWCSSIAFIILYSARRGGGSGSK